MILVETRGLSKTYKTGVFKKKDIQALSNVSLTVNPGEIFGLLGPNGAGKTTFIKILLSIVRPTSGQATMLDSPLGSVSIRQRIGYLPENHRYPSFLTARDTLFHFGRLQGIQQPLLQQRAVSLLDTVGLHDWSAVKIKRFSKGMLQRLGLAQALLSDPEILFLDEPTDGVDPVGRKEIRDILKTLRSQGKTIFLNSHMLSEVEEISDRVAILNKGEVLRTGTIKELTTQGAHYEIILQEQPSTELLASLRSLIPTLHVTDSKFLVELHDNDSLNRFLDVVRQKGFHLASLIPQRSRLEDYFIKLIKEGDLP